MTWHPLTIAIWFLLGMSWAVYLPAALRLIQVVPGWEPLGSGPAQLRRERLLELAAAQGRWTLGLQAGAAVLLIIGISNVWPSYIPGGKIDSSHIRNRRSAQVDCFQDLAAC